MDDIRLLPFASLASTSTKAAELVSKGEALPFAVLANEQSAGRGQRGRSWLSPSGGLYLTLALAAPPHSNPALIPLQAATIIARWLQAQFGVRITLKWPNDLYFAGRKLGGILCESSFSGEQRGPLFIGLGLNLTSMPPLPGPYQAIALQAVTPRSHSYTAADLAASLCAFWPSAWATIRQESLPEAFASFSIGSGQVWQGPAADYYRCDGIAADGSLLLQPWQAAAASAAPVTRLTSASNDFSWIYQSSLPAPLLVADIGNTASKLALFADRHALEPLRTWTLSSHLTADALQASSELAALTSFLSESFPTASTRLPQPWPVFATSVNDAARDQLTTACGAHGIRLEALAKRPVLSWGGHYQAHELGADRLALIEGWLAEFSREAVQRPEETLAVIVCAGTATTCDVVRGDGEHLGGFIVPGLQTSLDALSEKTERLPKIRLGVAGVGIAGIASATASDKTKLPEEQGGSRPTELGWLGHSTTTAMSQGIIAMTVGLIQRLAQQARTHASVPTSDVRIILTGGYASHLQAHLPAARLDSALVVKGIRCMAIGGHRPSEANS